ncbi:hypothetical protein H1P_480023 [Hyella patelloides LEGE 07179]|uniref:Uncharacterized protein n=1 Tax=Hyella patelloides LEGE 07179 TaxID=945734 RepID=A0A563VYX1_9CYAN|nr:hypothetical protein [Hyella patelloides]VEP16662.1 hypothetical protein H1P_480023 [Hyella patelloides LEGE 07179]
MKFRFLKTALLVIWSFVGKSLFGIMRSQILSLVTQNKATAVDIDLNMNTYFNFNTSFLMARLPIFLALAVAMFPVTSFAHTVGQLTERRDRGMRPAQNLRYHTVIQNPGSEELIPATVPPITESEISMVG